LALPGLMSLIFLAPAIGRADLMTTFDVSGTVENISGGALGSCAAGATCPFKGMFTVDATTGTVESTGLDITFPGLPDFDNLYTSIPDGPGWELGAENSSGDIIGLLFTTEPNPGSLVGFTGGTLAAGGPGFGGDSSDNYQIVSGTIAPVPEPTSLVLLAGVISWVVFDLKRRLAKKTAIR
jgi:hypothetical protein